VESQIPLPEFSIETPTANVIRNYGATYALCSLVLSHIEENRPIESEELYRKAVFIIAMAAKHMEIQSEPHTKIHTFIEFSVARLGRCGPIGLPILRKQVHGVHRDFTGILVRDDAERVQIPAEIPVEIPEEIQTNDDDVDLFVSLIQDWMTRNRQYDVLDYTITTGLICEAIFGEQSYLKSGPTKRLFEYALVLCGFEKVNDGQFVRAERRTQRMITSELIDHGIGRVFNDGKLVKESDDDRAAREAHQRLIDDELDEELRRLGLIE
jgi:hypothetical protein